MCKPPCSLDLVEFKWSVLMIKLCLFKLKKISKHFKYNCLTFKPKNSVRIKSEGYLKSTFKILLIIALCVTARGSSTLAEAPPHARTPYIITDCTYAKYTFLH